MSDQPGMKRRFSKLAIGSVGGTFGIFDKASGAFVLFGFATEEAAVAWLAEARNFLAREEQPAHAARA